MTSFSIVRGLRVSDILHRGEVAFLLLIIGVFCTNVVLSLTSNQTIAWHSFALSLFVCIGLVFCGGYLRTVRGANRSGKIILMLGLNSLFGLLMAIFFHLHFPRPEPMLTDALLSVDRWFGYDWPAAVAWVADVPNLGWALSLVYISSFHQIILVMMMLTFLHRIRDLEAMVFCNAIGLLIVFAIWQTFPNLSQSTYLPIPVDTALETHLITHSIYGKFLLDMATNGLQVVQMNHLLGQVAFPSYHMMMAALVVWFARRTILFWPILLINIVMVPAILIHGAHHVADVIGGILVLCLAVPLANRLINWLHRDGTTLSS